jgi:hypothetical protein
MTSLPVLGFMVFMGPDTSFAGEPSAGPVVLARRNAFCRHARC